MEQQMLAWRVLYEDIEFMGSLTNSVGSNVSPTFFILFLLHTFDNSSSVRIYRVTIDCWCNPIIESPCWMNSILTEFQKPLQAAFVDLKSAFDSFDRVLWNGSAFHAPVLLTLSWLRTCTLVCYHGLDSARSLVYRFVIFSGVRQGVLIYGSLDGFGSNYANENK